MSPAAEFVATEGDITACFRLLYGRVPTPQEWVEHGTLLGQPLAAVVQAYLDSKEHRSRQRGAGPSLRLTQLDGFSLYTDDNDLAVGRHVAGGVYEPEIAAQLRAHLQSGMTVIDIGANIGLFTMLAASLVGPAGSVLAVEPNPANMRMIEASRRANGFGHVTIAGCAVARQIAVLALESTHSNGMTAAPDGDLADLFDARLVPGLPLARLLPPQRVDFIKIDCEGAEYIALASIRDRLRRDRPVIVSEFNPRLLEPNSGVSGGDYLRLLTGLGYRLAVVTPDGAVPCGDPNAVLAIAERNAPHHIDLLLTPAQRSWLSRWRS